jgi:hypothetical protein
MQSRFFVGKDDKPVAPGKSDDDAAKHFAWCIENLMQRLKNAKSDDVRRAAIDKFISEMKSSKAASKMMTDEYEGILRVMMSGKSLPSNQDIIVRIVGIPVEPSKDYLTYSNNERHKSGRNM